MQIIKLFLTLFSFMLFSFTNRKRLMHILFIQFQVIQTLTRTVEQNNLQVRFQSHEKHLIAALFEETPRARRFFTLVSTKTVLTVWKYILAKRQTHKYKHKPGRKPLSKKLKDLILQMKLENFTWGARRIRDELQKLSIMVSHETICKLLNHYRKTGKIKPTLSWKRFLSSHWNSLFACDFFTVTSFSMVTFFVFFIIKLETRQIVQFGITENPNIQFLRNQFSEFEYKYPGSILIHDNSGELKWFPYNQYNIKDINTVPFSPNMNAYAERFIRSIRQECLDYFIIFKYNQLYRIVKEYVEYYNNFRPHQGLQGIPNGPPDSLSKTGTIKKISVASGLHYHYYREAA